MAPNVLTLIIQTGIIAVLGAVIVALINRRTAKLIQKATETQSDKIEKLKSDLAIEAAKQGKIYDNRLEVITGVRQKLVELQRDFQYMMSVKGFGESEQGKKRQVESEQKLHEKLEQFDMYVLTNAHYFKKSHAEMLVKISDTLRGINNDYLGPGFLLKISDGNILQEDYQKSLTGMIKASESVNMIIISFISQLDDEFRKLLGVEKQS